MTDPLPATRRAALLDIATRIDEGRFGRDTTPALVRLAGLLINEANRYPTVDGELYSELIGSEAAPSDYEIRREAVQCAAVRLQNTSPGSGTYGEQLIRLAEQLEPYLRQGLGT